MLIIQNVLIKLYMLKKNDGVFKMMDYDGLLESYCINYKNDKYIRKF